MSLPPRRPAQVRVVVDLHWARGVLQVLTQRGGHHVWQLHRAHAGLRLRPSQVGRSPLVHLELAPHRQLGPEGHEPELSGPLADSLALAAVAGLSVPGTVAVGGPGLDGELSGAYVRARMTDANAHPHRVTSADVKAYISALDWHPSEATALLSATALGIEGRAEIRDSAALVPVDATSADLLVADCQAVLALNRVAQQLAGSRSFAQVESITREVCGRTELDYERRKAASLAEIAYAPPNAKGLQARIAVHRRRASDYGATLISFRRLGEIAGLRTYEPDVIRAAAGELAYDDVPLCRL
jgi:Protein of unknown function (DUF1152)